MLINKRIIPILLLNSDVLYKTVQFKNPSYIGDPINILRIFNEKETDEIILLDISKKTQVEGPAFEFLQKISEETFSPISYGGGIKNVVHAEKILSLGFEKISFCTALYENPSLVRQCVKEFGAQAVIANIDVKKGFWGKHSAFVCKGKKKVKYTLQDYIYFVNDLGVGEMLVSDISREGTFLGYDFQLFQEITKLSNCPIIANGGANSLDNIEELFKHANISAAGAGRLFIYHGNKKAVLITYPSWQDKLGIANYAK